ncbi:hypothetical protein CMUS01_05794 [Colletotrichum musicola]|uniref:Uncharacterized protein n=1 Tax=Colletotrichum musicola TaxID=2175873 RepID=A0A8H6NK26_9PEZI|nr:hypothetical protein CMUS01_05794 [Colletotrichum musicola]
MDVGDDDGQTAGARTNMNLRPVNAPADRAGPTQSVEASLVTQTSRHHLHTTDDYSPYSTKGQLLDFRATGPIG